MEFFEGYSRSFFIAYAAGTVFLLLFCVERFDQPARSGSFVQTLVPKHLATHAEYLRTFLIYFFIMWVIYTLLTLAGPPVLQVFAVDTEGFALDDLVSGSSGEDPFSHRPSSVEGRAWFPLAVVLSLVGVSTKYPVFNSVERIVRRLTHSIIGIPEGIQKLAEDIDRSRIDLSALSQAEKEFIKKKYKAATGQDCSDIDDYYEKALYDVQEKQSLLVNWIRFNFLFYVFFDRKRELPKSFDTSVLESFPSMVTKIRASVYDLSDKSISDILRIDDGEFDDFNMERVQRMAQNISTALRDLYGIIAACIAHSSGNRSDASEAMKALKLQASSEKRVDLSNALITAFVVVFIFVLVVVFATPAAAQVLGFTPSRLFPADETAAVSWATSTVFLHGSAAFAAWRYRERIGIKWKPMKIRELDIPARQYLRVMALAVLAGTLGLVVWWFLKEVFVGVPLSAPSKNEFWIPLFGLLGASTGFWVCYSLDVAEREEVSMTRQLIQAVLQGVTTGGLCFLLMAMMPDERVELDLEVFAGAIACLTGLIIGVIIIPVVRQLYQKATIDDRASKPLAEVDR